MICLVFVVAAGLAGCLTAGDYVILKMDVEGAEFHGLLISRPRSKRGTNPQYQ